MTAESGTFELGTDGPSVILVGVDDSTTSIRAGWYAAGLARRQGARIVADNVWAVLKPIVEGLSTRD